MKTAVELAPRMEAFVRRCAELSVESTVFVVRATLAQETELADEARAIVAELPEPVDPDLFRAREIYATEIGLDHSDRNMKDIRAGIYDKSLPMRCILKALEK